MEEPVDVAGWSVLHAERHAECGWTRVTIQTPGGEVTTYTQTPPEALSRAAAQLSPGGRVLAALVLEAVADTRRGRGR